MNLTRATQAEAQALSDRCHAWLIANDEAYAASVAAGRTLQWAVPREQENGTWSVPVSERVAGALTEGERNEAGFVASDPL